MVVAALLCCAALLLVVASTAVAAGRWSLVAQPEYGLGAGDTAQFEISCVSSASCWALGSGESSNTLMHFNGSRLRILSTTFDGPRGPNPSATEMACVSAQDCMVVGVIFIGRGTSLPLAVGISRWDGKRWRNPSFRVRPPAAVARSREIEGELTSIACPSSSMCLAVGGWFGFAAHKRVVLAPLAARFDGSRWSVIPVPVADAYLGSVACASATDCVAIGASGVMPSLSGPPPTPISLAFDGSAWSPITFAAVPGVSQLAPVAVSCPSSGACVAVGGAVQTAVRAGKRVRSKRAAILSLSGATWIPSIVPDSPALARIHAAKNQSLAAVSCAPGAVSRCVAVGTWLNSDAALPKNHKLGGLAATVTAGRAQLSPLPVDDVPESISCPTVTFCLAGGLQTLERFDIH
jgi:hypothetical protein